MADSDLLSDLLISDYSEEESSDIQRLELECCQTIAPDFPFKYVKVARIYHSPYHARVRMFPKSFTLTATVASREGVVGLVSGALKQTYYDNHPCTVGYIFDLRVHDKMLRAGIGLRLVEMCEQRLIAMGAELLYAIIFTSNLKAEMMFNSALGYKIATKKTIHIEAISTKEKPGEFPLSEVSKTDAERHLKEFYKDKDLTPMDFSEFFSKKEYLGTYCVCDSEGNRAETSLWDCTVHTSKAITEIYFPVEMITVPSFYIPFFICSVLMLVFGALSAVSLYETIPVQVLKLTFAALALLALVLALEFLTVFAKYWKECVKTPKGARKVMLFGLHFVGNSDITEVLYDDLLSSIRHKLSGKTENISWFVDETDPHARCFSSPVHNIVYVQKKPKALMWNAWTRNLFYDPRDLV